jgi:Tfp pilus assembly protein PilX
MIARFRRAIARFRAGDDSGIALITVIGSMMVLTMFASAGLALAVNSMPVSRHDQDFNAALAAAQAGVDDYVHHLNNDDSYWLNAHCENTALTGPNDPDCPAAAPGWVAVNSGDPNGPVFHYDIDTSTLASANNSITVTSTGRVHGVTRTIQVSVSRGGSTQFVYYTDYEDADPTNSVVYRSGPPSNSYCYKHYWEGRSSNESGCVEINFISGDVINGKVHTNDTPLMNGTPAFGDNFEVSDPACKTATASNNDYYGCWHGNTGSRPNFQKPPPKYAAQLQLPDNTNDMSKFPGCGYVGSTRIRFTGDGKMLVWSPNSVVPAACGGSHPMGVSVAVPDNQVIYVSAAPSTHQCAAGEIGDGLPLSGDLNMTYADQYCGQGNLYVEGSIKGRVTMAAENSIVLTGDLTLAGGLNGTDMAGLVAGNSVEVMHPWLDFNATSCPSGTSSVGATYTRTPGKWVSAGAGGTPPKSGMVWQGENWTQDRWGNWSVTRGGWVNQPTDSKGRAQLWQAGYWSQDSRGNWSWTSGKWVVKSGNYGYDSSSGWQSGASGKYWLGESWDPMYECQGESSTYPHMATSGHLSIYASIQTLQHSFFVQSYDKGEHQGSLDVYGSIAQRYRGIVGTGDQYGTGYLKNYNYDTRLVYSSPPYFPQWVGASWSAGRVGEVSPMYTSG